MTKQFKLELEKLLAQNDVEIALKRLDAYCKNKNCHESDEYDVIILLQGRLARLKRDLQLEKIDNNYYESQLEDITRAVFRLINDIVDGESVTSSLPKTSKSTPFHDSIFDLIKERVKKLPDLFWPKKSAQSPLNNNTETTAPPEELGVDLNDGDFEPIMPPSSPAPTIEPESVPQENHTSDPKKVGGAESPFKKGKILYAIPEQMSLADSSRCLVRIAPDHITTDELEFGLKKEEKEIGKNESLKITQVMKVELVEANDLGNFDITARNSEEQPILPFGFTEWTFDVRSKRPGHHALLLRVSAKINIPSYGERAFDVAVLDRAVIVTTSAQAQQELSFTEQEIPDPSWDEEDEQAVINALELGRTDKALERIANFVQDKDRDFQTEVIMLQSRWNDNANQLAENLVTASDWDVLNNRIRHSIIKLLESLKLSYPIDGEGKSMDWKKEKEALANEVV